MEINSLRAYRALRDNGAGFFEQKRGLIEVSGGEAIMFLNGLITNDAAKLESYRWMLAAFPNAQGRLLAVTRVLRFDEKFLFETEAITHEKILKNLERFTLAGDFKVKDLTEEFSCLSVRGREISNFEYKIPTEYEIIGIDVNKEDGFIIRAFRADGFDAFIPGNQVESFSSDLENLGTNLIDRETQEVLRVESGLPLYGVDMDETTVVLETGLDEAVSFNKGCYIGQEIIARINFRGHVAKKLTGLVFEDENATVKANDEIKSADGKNAGRITSIVFSPLMEKKIALAYVRYDYLAEATKLTVNDFAAQVKNLPFVR